ncbi:cell surface protein [Mucilaginibacter robiniae]|nr:cell surface protein [Mucilaginibacter robiniae]
MSSIWSSCKKDKADHTSTSTTHPVTAQSSAYVTQMLEYKPAPGQFINTSTGNATAAQSVLNTNAGLVSLGAFGGYIVLGFDHTVINQANQNDIIVYGNASTGFAEPGVIWVMQDTNGNGKADDIWYELAGSTVNQTGYRRNYSVTYTRPANGTGDVAWTDNLGNSGTVKANSFHTQAYYPTSITSNTYTLAGTLLPSTNIDSSNSTYVTSTAFAYGYADQTSGGDQIDIARAVDTNGNAVQLTGIDFIKIQTGIQYNLGWLGELSTEVAGVADLSLLKK